MMKILSVAWTVQDSHIPALSGELTGAGIVIHNICEYIGRQTESYLLIGQLPMQAVKTGHINYLSNGLTEMAARDNKKRLECVVNAFRENVLAINPDFVNFHGEGDFICECIKICQCYDIPFVSTIHLYVGKNQDIPGYEKAKDYWKNLLEIPNVKFITVGNGLKKKILSDYPQIESEKIAVIQNGTDYVAEYKNSTIYEKLGLENAKVLILAGTVNERKNQIQVVRAYQLLSEDYRNHIKVIFCGKDCNNGKLQQYIRENNLEKNMLYVGPVAAAEMCKCYSVANGYVMPSLAEGLSISELEALRYGMPLIMFADSECAFDLNDKKVVVLAEKRNDAMLAEAIIQWYENEWDSSYIKEYSKKFQMENVAEAYVDYYKSELRMLNKQVKT